MIRGNLLERDEDKKGEKEADQRTATSMTYRFLVSLGISYYLQRRGANVPYVLLEDTRMALKIGRGHKSSCNNSCQMRLSKINQLPLAKWS